MRERGGAADGMTVTGPSPPPLPALAVRDELAADLGVTANHVSRIMSELERIGAITRLRVRVPGLRGPGPVRYLMNPRVGTHLSGEARRQAQADAPRLVLVE